METVTTVLLWLLGVVFLGAGAMKALMPEEKLLANPNMGWVERTGIAQARIAGATEVAAAVVFLLTALGVLEDRLLAGLAAVGIVVVMVLAAVRVHAPADEPIVPNLVLGLLAAVLAVGALTA